MSLKIPSSFQPMMHVRRQLGKVRAVVVLWRLLKRIVLAAQYYGPRLVGHATYPILGRRAPFLGYYERAREFFQHGDGRYISYDSINGSTLSDPFEPEIFVAAIPGC